MLRKTPSVRVVLAFVIAGMIPLAAPAQDDQKDEKPAGQQTETEKEAKDPALLDPKLAKKRAPYKYRVKFETTKGDFVVEVRKKWSSKGASRFYNLVDIGFYDGCYFYRVMPKFMAQAGINGDPEVQAAWSKATIKDEKIKQPNTRGTVTFTVHRDVADSRATQFFINMKDNTYPKDYGPYVPFGQVVEGMEVVDALYADYGESSSHGGKGPLADEIESKGNAYLKENFPKLDYIKRATLLGR